jgi:aminoglycoside phosphotransferase (APT) family kinase protein
VTHGDFRLDNLLFGGPRVAVVDWQTVGLSAGIGDVAYFLGGSLAPDVRRAGEEALVREYHHRLVVAGAEQSWDDCWAGYRRYALGGLMMAILASQVVVRTERGDAMFTVMAEHAGRHALDLDAESFLT